MTKPNTYHAYFTLVGDFNPSDISARLGMLPSRSWNKGEINAETELERNHSRWSLNSRLSETETLEKQVADVLEQLQPHASAIADVLASIDGLVQLVAYFYTGYTGFGLEANVVDDLAQMKLGIDCDFYYLYSDEREDSE
jgi:hypothetical protein